MSDGKDSLDLSALGAAVPNAVELRAEDKASIVESIKGLAVRRTDVLEDLEPNVRNRIELLRDIQLRHDMLEAKFCKERAAHAARYQKMYEQLYTERYEVVNGTSKVEGVTKDDAGESTADQKGFPAEETGVPDFWFKALKNHEILAEEISKRDGYALKYLKDIQWYKITEPKGFKLEFHFKTNPFFENEVLTKTYHMIDEDEPILEKAIGTEIVWNDGKCLTKKVLTFNPTKRSKKPIVITENCDSFFNFFSPPEVPDDNKKFDVHKLQQQLEKDYHIGYIIRDKIIPHATSWFTGEADQDEEFVGIMDEEEDGDEDDEEDDEDDEEDDEDDDEEDDPKVGQLAAVER